MYQRKVINKIPGELPPPPKQENQGFIEDLGKKQKFELEELLQRQNKILANKSFLSKLPDKGEKIKNFRDKILKELEHKNEIENAANLLSRLNLASEGKVAMNELEWTGKYSETKNAVKVVELDSDDEEDPLKILAQPTGSGVHKKKIIHLPPEESLIKSEDLAEIESFKAASSEVEHVQYIVNKVEKPPEEKNRKKELFKPYKTTKSNVHDPEKEKQRKQNKHWEVTAATPPPIVHSAAKIINLNESLKLQMEHAAKLQEIQTKHAAEKLAEQLGLHGIGPLPKNVGSYHLRDEKNCSSSSTSEDEEENEVHDEEDNDKRGTVVFTIDSVEN
ncbi:DNA-directed RNA polymerase II subunit GRINL1A [Hylaeus volcanicus]|uniref:DNA-directed RNA polymerase II subunit GRINL1A n=1 Tax=Hylaeus volcanicus TaxID=313075 RepID=UPI0023B81A07|nr:DNA-directed RNA polymerase II subunit GRINL1A [Hylaeus volcanicus]XP_053994237.1 DNA-directed RNA polymerase II subunit GRINL1A [Hylaeus volcanicus]